jgi:DNA-binding CsgD family transcriptional regulator
MELTGALSTEDLEILVWRSQGLSDGEIAEKVVDARRKYPEAARREEAARRKEAEAVRRKEVEAEAARRKEAEAARRKEAEADGSARREGLEILAWRGQGLSDGQIAEKIVAARRKYPEAEAARREEVRWEEAARIREEVRREEAARREEVRKEKEAEAERNFEIMMSLPEGERLKWLKMQKGKIYIEPSGHPLIFSHTFIYMFFRFSISENEGIIVLFKFCIL